MADWYVRHPSHVDDALAEQPPRSTMPAEWPCTAARSGSTNRCCSQLLPRVPLLDQLGRETRATTGTFPVGHRAKTRAARSGVTEDRATVGEGHPVDRLRSGQAGAAERCPPAGHRAVHERCTVPIRVMH